MSSNTPPTTTIPPVLVSLRSVLGPVLLVGALAFAVAVLYLLLTQGSIALGRPVFYWSLLLAFASLAIGLLILLGKDRQDPAALESYRIQVMTWGGIAGLLTALLGLALPFTSDYYSVFAGGLANWRDKPSGLIWSGLAFLSGLVLLFLSLNLARGTERASGLLRRLLYGYNVVLSSVLLLLILLLVNVLGYVRLRPFDTLGRTIDMTSSGIYSIGEPTKAILRSLQEPMNVTIMMEGDGLAQEMENLLETCATYSNNFRWKSLDLHRNPKEISELQTKYTLPEPVGVLVVYGKDHEFVGVDQLIPKASQDPNNQAARFSFAGENGLLNAMRFLLDGKTKPKLYFLQGHGELELDQNDPLSRSRPDVGMGLLRDALTERGYEIKALKFELENPKVPDEADIVVIARPTTPIPQKELDALLAYTRGAGSGKKGRLIVLGDVLQDGSSFRTTGIETLVSNFNVRFKNERLLALQGVIGLEGKSDPMVLGVGPTRLQGPFLSPGDNPISAAYYDPKNRMPFRMYDVRALEVGENNPNAPSAFSIDPLLFPWPEQRLWGETDLNKNPEALAADYRANLGQFAKIMKRDFVPIAVAISEEGANRGPHSAPGTPRLVVFGDATWISNYGIERLSPDGASLFGSCINWLREKPAAENLVRDKDRKEYRLNITSEADFWNLALIPGTLLVLMTIALGLGVWVVRRR